MKPKLLVLHGKRFFDMPTYAESDAVREIFDIVKSQRITGRPDVVYCQSYLQCRAELAGWGGPCVIPVAGYPWEFDKRKTKMVAGLLTQNSGRVLLFMSRWLKKEFGRRGLDAGKGALVTHLPHGYWGIDHVISGAQVSRFAVKTDYSLGDPPTAIMAINLSERPEWRKLKCSGIPIMLRAMRDVARKWGVKFVCAGIIADDFPYLDKWRDLYNFHAVRSHYKDDEVDRWPGMLVNADIFLHPSMCDGWGRSVADAMCAGVPSLVLDVTAPPEIGDSLIKCDPQDAESMVVDFEELLQDMNHRREVGRTQHAEALRLTEEHRGDLAQVLLEAVGR